MREFGLRHPESCTPLFIAPLSSDVGVCDFKSVYFVEALAVWPARRASFSIAFRKSLSRGRSDALAVAAGGANAVVGTGESLAWPWPRLTKPATAMSRASVETTIITFEVVREGMQAIQAIGTPSRGGFMIEVCLRFLWARPVAHGRARPSTK